MTYHLYIVRRLSATDEGATGNPDMVWHNDTASL